LGIIIKKAAELKAENEAFKRIRAEVINEINEKPIDTLVDESNKRHGRG